MSQLVQPAEVAASAPALPPIVSLKNVSRRFGKQPDMVGRALQAMHLAKPRRPVSAVEDVSLEIHKGEVLGLVGESGCGKSTLGRIVAGILPPSGGTVEWQGRDIETMSSSERVAAKLRVQMIFQNPFASLNPRLRIGDIIGEAPAVHGFIEGDRNAYVDQQMRRTGLDPSLKNRYPHQFSGGQRQRICIARALAVNPEFLVCDEAVAALDVSIQAQVLNLFIKLRQELQLTYLFISHDLGVVEHLSDRVAIMYLGRIVEQASATEIFSRANHPYTQALLAEMPRIETEKRPFSTLKGELPSPLNPPSGCHFHPRCPRAIERCHSERPALKSIAPGHLSACHLNDQA